MTRTKSYLVIALLASVVIAISACNMPNHHNRTSNPAGGERYAGPPPDAPAHGYRYKQSDGIELVFDSGIGVYVVSGHTDHYYHQGSYYRWNNGSWEVSSKISEGWGPASDERIPPGLRKTHEHEKGNNPH